MIKLAKSIAFLAVIVGVFFICQHEIYNISFQGMFAGIVAFSTLAALGYSLPKELSNKDEEQKGD